MPSARPSGRGRFPVGHLHDFLEHRASTRRDRHALKAEIDRVHAFGRCHLVDERLDGEDVEDVADRAPVLEADAVRHAARLDVLVRDLVVGNADAGLQQHATVADHAVRPAGNLAVLVERSLAGTGTIAGGTCRARCPPRASRRASRAASLRARCAPLRRRSRRASAGRSRRPCSTDGASPARRLKPSALATASREHAGVLRAFPDFDLVAGSVEPRDRVQRFHLRVIAVVAEELGLVGLRRAARSALFASPFESSVWFSPPGSACTFT